jgi:Acetyl xylan esterase (AXE1)
MPSKVERYQAVECKTIDGIVIRGCFYAVAGRAPTIIMTPGVSTVPRHSDLESILKDHSSTASRRCCCQWSPRNFRTLVTMRSHTIHEALAIAMELQGIKSIRSHKQRTFLVSSTSSQVSLFNDSYSADILSFVTSLPSVDPSRITLWGMSFGGTVSTCAAAVDRRVKSLIMLCPILGFYKPEKREKAFAQLIKDRQSILRGNEPYTLPPFNSRGENPIGMAGSGGPGGAEAYGFMNAVLDRGASNFRNRITLQTYHKLAMWSPKELLRLVDRTPVMMITPELDTVANRLRFGCESYG